MLNVIIVKRIPKWIRFPFFQILVLFFLYSSSISGAPFVDNGDGTITDLGNALIWQKTADGTQRNWANALTYCNGLSLTSRVWRLPSVTELRSILDHTQATSPIINGTYFLGTVNQYYWTSTTYRYSGGTVEAWAINFTSGFTSSGGKTASYYVRCVASPP
ncbi:DUF1566 domain-containing protein [Leptospira sp. 201903070]|uniref:DUF1566 domain-containing protein n=1 Tax=Leptospira ainlahdjerensis TaxID=2810033 RepID=A0ABS2UCD7_9LEPT|nr:DUF1566 domain-containing protein [Leptospira ainlahdjerensis]MBM9576590.1 DUF1566 domain-containing protein [Leptospira ainlahdjerensis]